MKNIKLETLIPKGSENYEHTTRADVVEPAVERRLGDNEFESYQWLSCFPSSFSIITLNSLIWSYTKAPIKSYHYQT